MTTPAYITTHELAERWRMSPTTLAHWRSIKYGPQAVKFPPRRVLYPMTAVLEWESKR